MRNEYVASDVVEVGSAEDLILDWKGTSGVEDMLGGYAETVAFDD